MPVAALNATTPAGQPPAYTMARWAGRRRKKGKSKKRARRAMLYRK